MDTKVVQNGHEITFNWPCKPKNEHNVAEN